LIYNKNLFSKTRSIFYLSIAIAIESILFHKLRQLINVIFYLIIKRFMR